MKSLSMISEYAKHHTTTPTRWGKYNPTIAELRPVYLPDVPWLSCKAT